MTLLSDPGAETVLDRLHARDRAQLWTLGRYYLPRVIWQWVTRKPMVIETDNDFLRDKLVALDRSKGELAYSFCRALGARRAVEVGTSFGVSTIYLAAAVRDNEAVSGAPGIVIGSEIEPAKVAAANANLQEAGLRDHTDIRVGNALEMLKDCGGPVDFLLIDTWMPLARPAIELLTPQLREGAVVMCDNVSAFAEEYRPFTDFVRDRANGFRSMLWPKSGGVEISIRTDV